MTVLRSFNLASAASVPRFEMLYFSVLRYHYGYTYMPFLREMKSRNKLHIYMQRIFTLFTRIPMAYEG